MDKFYVITEKIEHLSEVFDYDPEFHVLCVFSNLDSAKKHLLKLSMACSQHAESSVCEYGFWYKSQYRKISVYLERIDYIQD